LVPDGAFLLSWSVPVQVCAAFRGIDFHNTSESPAHRFLEVMGVIPFPVFLCRLTFFSFFLLHVYLYLVKEKILTYCRSPPDVPVSFAPDCFYATRSVCAFPHVFPVAFFGTFSPYSFAPLCGNFLVCPPFLLIFPVECRFFFLPGFVFLSDMGRWISLFVCFFSASESHICFSL